MTKTYLQEKQLKELKKKMQEKIKSLKTDNFDELVKILMDKSFIFDTKKLLDLSFEREETLVNTRSFLSCFMINSKPEEIFNQVGDLERALMSMSEKLIEDYELFLGDNDNNFIKSYDNFLNFFNNWKKNDLTMLLFVLSSAYQDLILTKEKIKSSNYENQEEKDRAEIWMEEIENQKKLIESSVRKIGGEEILESFLTGKFFMDLVSGDFKDKIIMNLQKAYFEKIKIEINNLGEEKPFTLIKTLKEIKDLLFKMVPSREDLHQKWTKDLNIELLEQKLDKKSYQTVILDIFDKIYDIIKICESGERNDKTDELKDKLKNWDNEEIDSFIIENLQKIYEKINFVFSDIKELKNKLEKKN